MARDRWRAGDHAGAVEALLSGLEHATGRQRLRLRLALANQYLQVQDASGCAAALDTISELDWAGYDPDDPLRQEELLLRATMHIVLGTERNCREALALAQSVISRAAGTQSDPRQVGRAFHVAGTAHAGLSQPRLAHTCSLQAVAILDQHLGPEHPDTLAAQGQLAATLQQVGKPSRSVGLRRRLAETVARLYGADDVRVLRRQHELAQGLLALGPSEEARHLLEAVREGLLARHREDVGELALTELHLAQACAVLGEAARARTLVAAAELRLDDDRQWGDLLSLIANEQGLQAAADGNHGEAFDLFVRAIVLLGVRRGHGSWLVARLLSNLGYAAWCLEQWDEARSAFQDALTAARGARVRDADLRLLAGILVSLGALEQQVATPEGDSFLAEGIEILEGDASPAGTVLLARARAWWAGTTRELGLPAAVLRRC
jgi:tetratricopeptide (TPR) repeat protein